MELQPQDPTNPLQPELEPEPDPSNGYWAMKPLGELVGELQGQERGWWQAGVRRGYWSLLRLMYAQSQGMDPGGALNQTQQLTFQDKTKSFVRFRVNLARSHIKQRNVMAQGERVSFQCLSLNSDFASMSGVQTAQSGIDYVFRATRGEAKAWQALEADGYFGEGFLWGRWDPTLGGDVTEVVGQEPSTDENGQPITWGDTGEPVMRDITRTRKGGMPTLSALYPWEVVRDPYAKNDPPWVMVREVVSKHSVAARYKEHAKEILAVDNLRSEAGIAEMFAYDMGAVTTDQIIVRHFYHRASPECPNGRYVGVAGDVPLWDEPCPLPEGVPLHSICSARYFGTLFGYPECSDLLSLQEMLDEMLTQCGNNALRYGNQSLWAEDGVEVDMKKLARGGGFFNYKTGQKPPQTIQWSEMPAITQFIIQYATDVMPQLSGMNPTARGVPDANVQSGTFAALLLNVAQKFVSATEQSYDDMLTGAGNMMLAFLHANADTEFVGIIAGESQKPYLKQFKGQDFKSIQRVQVATANPLMRTIPGRFEVFNAISKLPTKAERAAGYQMLTTGNADAFTEADQASNYLIQWENEQMMQGIEVPVAVSDDPLAHNRKHKACYDRIRTMYVDPADTEGLQLRNQALMLLQAHMSNQALAWAMADPIFLDSLEISRPALPWAPYDTVPINPALGQQPSVPPLPAGPPGGDKLNSPDGGLPGQPKPAGPPQNAPQEPAQVAGAG